MSCLIEKAFAAIRKLPEVEQEAIARGLLERIEADARWGALFADPRSKRALERLAAQVEAEIKSGDVFDLDPADGGIP